MILGEYAGAWIDLDAALVAKPAKRPKLSGGSHDTDWRCPYCRHFNSIKRRLCAQCVRSPGNGRLTRAALRERVAEHRVEAILSKRGLPFDHLPGFEKTSDARSGF
jgi:hypothetical protein